MQKSLEIPFFSSRPVRGFTSVIGLAVVMALALAAVIGAMSLANPAMAAPEAPADSRLTERTVSPQEATLQIHAGATREVDLIPYLDGKENVIDAIGVDATGGLVVSPTASAGDITVANVSGYQKVAISITAAAGSSDANVGNSYIVAVPVSFTDETETKTLQFVVETIAPTPAVAVGEMDDITVAANSRSSVIDVADFFDDGMGTSGAVVTYNLTSTNTAITFQSTADTPGDITTLTVDNADAESTKFSVFVADATPNGTLSIMRIEALDAITTGNNATQSFLVRVGDVDDGPGDMPEVTADTSSDPGDNSQYTIMFKADADPDTAGSQDIRSGIDQIVIEFTDFSVPSSIDASAVAISVEGPYNDKGIYDPDGPDNTAGNTDDTPDRVVTNTADGVSVDGEKVIIDLKISSDDFVDVIKGGESVTVVVRQSAGISNPTEAKDYDEIEVNGVVAMPVSIDLKLSLSEDEGGRNDTITVTGKGFKNGTTMTAYKLIGKDTGFTNAQSLCSATVGSDDVGKCEFTVTSPLFMSGANYINVKDGRNQSVDSPKEFTLEPSISVSPAGASVGDSVQVQMYDFISGSSVQGVRIARQYLCMQSGMPVSLMDSCGTGYSNWSPGGSASALGELSFNVTIPDGAPQGSQELRVETATENDATNIIISGPVITSTPSIVLANQRVSLTGTGFTAGSEIEVITFAGEVINPANINGSEDVNVDNGGNWSASVVLPMTNSTTSSGEHAVKVRDTAGRGGQVMVTVPERTVTITPDTGRVGTLAVVRGENFPSKNDDGEAFSVTIEYAASNGKTTSTTVPDASGRFEAEIRIPTTATIPSTNSVTVSFTTAAGTQVPILVNHNVPEGGISLSTTSGSPGSTISVSGEGFKQYVPVSSVKVGSIEVTPSPRPSTNAQGMMEFDITIPGLDSGIQTVEVMVGGTTASTGFTVTPASLIGASTPVAQALEPLGDNLDSIWHFNNDTKSWTFYDGLEGSDLTHVFTGQTYWIQIKSTQEVILNTETRNLTCSATGNCWNQEVW